MNRNFISSVCSKHSLCEIYLIECIKPLFDSFRRTQTGYFVTSTFYLEWRAKEESKLDGKYIVQYLKSKSCLFKILIEICNGLGIKMGAQLLLNAISFRLLHSTFIRSNKTLKDNSQEIECNLRTRIHNAKDVFTRISQNTWIYERFLYCIKTWHFLSGLAFKYALMLLQIAREKWLSI